MPLSPVHSDQMLRHIAAPYVTWCSILICIAAHIAIAEIPPDERAFVLHTFGVMPGALLGDAVQPSFPLGLPSLLTLVTYAFVHGSNAHLIGNMVVLFVFGSAVEDRLRHFGFICLFGAAAALGAIAEVLAADTTSFQVIVGASGAISGVLGAYIVLFPRAKIGMLLPIFVSVAVRAWVVIGGWFLYDVFMLYQGQGNIAWLAHIAGFCVGALVAVAVRARGMSNDEARKPSA